MFAPIRRILGGVQTQLKNKATIPDILSHIEEQGEHLIMIEDGILTEKVGERIDKSRSNESISIKKCDAEKFLRLFLKVCQNSDTKTGIIGFDTHADKITIYGGPITFKLIRNSSELQELSIAAEEIKDYVEVTRTRVKQV